MSNTQRIGKHSTACVHRVVKRGKHAGARQRGNLKRRVFELPGTETHEHSLHFTKGYRVNARRNFAVQDKAELAP